MNAAPEFRLCSTPGCSQTAGHPLPCDQGAQVEDAGELFEDAWEWVPLVFTDDPRLPDHLRADCPMVECYRCHRQTVRDVAGRSVINDECGMTQPDGSRCDGRFIASTIEWGESGWHR